MKVPPKVQNYKCVFSKFARYPPKRKIMDPPLLVRHSIHVFALHRFHPLQHLQHNSNSTNPHDLLPLLVFPEDSSNYQLRCIKLGSKMYIFGLPNYCTPLEYRA